MNDDLTPLDDDRDSLVAMDAETTVDVDRTCSCVAHDPIDRKDEAMPPHCDVDMLELERRLPGIVYWTTPKTDYPIGRCTGPPSHLIKEIGGTVDPRDPVHLMLDMKERE